MIDVTCGIDIMYICKKHATRMNYDSFRFNDAANAVDERLKEDPDIFREQTFRKRMAQETNYKKKDTIRNRYYARCHKKPHDNLPLFTTLFRQKGAEIYHPAPFQSLKI